MIFTKLDETGSFGPILNEAVRTGKPLSFFATGQRIPEDLEAATKSRVAELVLGGTSGRAVSAALGRFRGRFCARCGVSNDQ